MRTLGLSILLLLSHLQVLGSSACDSAHRLQVLGSGGPEVQDKRASSSYLVWIDNQAKVLIDAGGGSALRFGQAEARLSTLDVVAFTHLHVDHATDFPALIKSSFFESQRGPLPVFGPTGNHLMTDTEDFVKQLFHQNTGAFPYLSDYLDREQKSHYF